MRILILAALILVIALPALAAEKPEMTSVEGKHIIFKARADDMKLLNDPKAWVANLDKAYEAYTDLVGATPFNGKKITILSTEEFPGGWAVAGNPILWYRDCFLDSIERMNKGDWSFGILHEIGHDFDLDDRWNWNAEMLANFKMDYAADKAKALIFVYGRDEICDYGDPKSLRMTDIYSKDEAGINSEEILIGDVGDSQFHRRLTELVSEIGWEPFKKVFRWFNTLAPDEMQYDGLNRRSLFIRALEEQSGVKIADRLINKGYSHISVDAKDANAAARILHDKNWHADVAKRPINAAPGEKVIVSVDVAERNPVNFKKGLATQAESEIVYDLDGKYKTFESYVGIPGRDAAENRWGDGVFEVMADGKKVYESPVLTGGGTYKYVSVNIDGTKELKLIVKRNCHAAWADAKVTDAEGKVVYLSDLKPVSVKHGSDGEIHLDKDMDNNPLALYYGPPVQPIKITGMVDGKSIELRTGRVVGSPETYEYEFESGFDKGLHKVHLMIKVGDKLTQHEFVNVVVK